jgi:hypothetical protein
VDQRDADVSTDFLELLKRRIKTAPTDPELPVVIIALTE